ncbi:hypothetical protein VSX64_15335 [Aurantimonas sp. C2-6-R+9]|uniref:hypothetical protein n=2 Tax=Aurantimonas TaxID=182269 RepID=UPI002E17951E|nr:MULTISPECIES: hypothetical protein [unclassified Aurantimonas]MEC5292077.1 hypothetical protein [Aurantimonas sp. C2-3-R2]MEC5382241.1 hypothetical protein [Aurantimonas sp. C2-6-R+9]MEC5413163.1 hypothetical protein [Aurantimonas sp. C2-4-R8]
MIGQTCPDAGPGAACRHPAVMAPCADKYLESVGDLPLAGRCERAHTREIEFLLETTMRTVIAMAILGVMAASPAFADSTTGTVAAFDRVDHILVLNDKTIWDLSPVIDLVPEDLRSGDKIKITYTSAGDNGWGKVDSISAVEK